MLSDPNAIGRRRWFQISLPQTSCIILQVRKIIYLKNKNKIINLLFLNTFKVDPYQRKHETCNILKGPPPSLAELGYSPRVAIKNILKNISYRDLSYPTQFRIFENYIYEVGGNRIVLYIYYLFIVRYQNDIQFLVLN